MCPLNTSKVIKLATFKALPNEPDPLVRNHDGTLIKVMEAPLIRALAKGLGVTFNIVIPEDGETGIQKPDGTWTGILGMLIRGEVDLSSTQMIVTEERREALNFTYPLQVTDYTFMTDKLKPISKSFAICDAFSLEVWASILLSVILVSLVIKILLKGKETYSAILIETIGCLLEKSFSFHARQRNTSALLLFWFLGITVLTNSYKSIILSVITVPRMVGIRDIKELSEAAKDKSTMCMMYKGLGFWHKESNDNRLKLIGECVERAQKASLNGHPQFFNYTHKKVFISTRTDLIKFSSDYFISEDSFSVTRDAMPYSKQFCCPKKLERVVHRLAAADIFPKMIRDRYHIVNLRRSKIMKLDNERTQWKPLALKHFTGAFLVLIIGHFSSLLIFIAEIISKTILRKIILISGEN